MCLSVCDYLNDSEETGSEEVDFEENLNEFPVPELPTGLFGAGRLPNKPTPDRLCVEIPDLETEEPPNPPDGFCAESFELSIEEDPPLDGLCGDALERRSWKVQERPFDVLPDFAS